MAGTGFIWFGCGQVVGPCEHGNKPKDSMKCKQFLNWTRSNYSLKKETATWN